MGAAVGVACLVGALLALRGDRRAYGAFVGLGLLYFPLRVGFRLRPSGCELAPSAALALHSLRNGGHVVLFALFYVVSRAQWPREDRAGWRRALLATVTMGALVELAQGATGAGNCRLRDLIPDTVGAGLGAGAVAAWRAARARLRPAT